jgi:hypothetical protein
MAGEGAGQALHFLQIQFGEAEQAEMGRCIGNGLAIGKGACQGRL